MDNVSHSLQKETRKKIFWAFFFILLMIGSIGLIIGFNKEFSLKMFLSFLKGTNIGFIIFSILVIVFYILAEGWSIVTVAKAFGYTFKKSDALYYAAADIYFSAVTPSASGGQPASAYFMLKDGISGPVVTVSLLYTLFMYSISIILLNVVVLILHPSIFIHLDWMAQLLVVIGFMVQSFFLFLFYCLLYKDKSLKKISIWGLNLLVKLHLIKNREEKLKRLDDAIERYQASSKMIHGKKNVLIKLFLFNLLQRICQIGVIILVFLATGGSFSDVFDIFVIECLVIMGAYSIPIPGAMGVTDYLMLNGFLRLMPMEQAVNLELLSRGVSFYFCILSCGILVIIRYLKIKRSSKL